MSCSLHPWLRCRLDLSWLHAELARYYSSFARPPIDPVLMIRMLVVGCVCHSLGAFTVPRVQVKGDPITQAGWIKRSNVVPIRV